MGRRRWPDPALSRLSTGRGRFGCPGAILRPKERKTPQKSPSNPKGRFQSYDNPRGPKGESYGNLKAALKKVSRCMVYGGSHHGPEGVLREGSEGSLEAGLRVLESDVKLKAAPRHGS